MKAYASCLWAACCLGTTAPTLADETTGPSTGAVPASSSALVAPLTPEEAAYLAQSETTRVIAQRYFAAYIDRDWDRLGRDLHAQARWSDPTAANLFGGTQAQGKDAVLAYFRSAYASITEMRASVTRSYFSDQFALYEGTLDWTVTVGKDKAVRTPAMPLVVVLQMQDGLVIAHQDFADYAGFIDAFRKLRAKAPRAD